MLKYIIYSYILILSYLFYEETARDINNYYKMKMNSREKMGRKLLLAEKPDIFSTDYPDLSLNDDMTIYYFHLYL